MPVLNTADKLYLGTQTVGAMYLGATKVWPPFTPKDISGLAMWLDATQAGDPHVQWNDVSGNGKHMVNVGGTGPTVVPNVLNGKPVVHFTVSEGRLRNSSTGISTNYTLTYVTRITGTTGRMLSAIYPPPNYLVGFHISGMDLMYDNGFLNNGVGWTVPTPWKMYGADGAGSLSRFFINGVESTTTTPGGNAGLGGTLALSGYDAATAAESVDGDVAELVMYNRKLSDAERQQVESYLRARWGI